jgi:hypothetical protein
VRLRLSFNFAFIKSRQMKNHLSKTSAVILTVILSFLLGQLSLSAQTKTSFPASFTIAKAELSKVLSFKLNETVSLKSNSYLDKSTVVYAYQNSDINVKQIKLKLNYFKDAFLTVQINADNSKQIFITSDKTEANYKNIDFNADDVIVMEKCKKDNIITD